MILDSPHANTPGAGHEQMIQVITHTEPGGRADATDADLLATAARETFEEIGVRLAEEGAFIGRRKKAECRA